jgi:hypothetical protein
MALMFISVLLVGDGTASHCVAGTIGEGTALSPFRLVGVGLANKLWWRARKVRALPWPLFSR